MAITIDDKSLGIEVKGAYVKLASFLVNESGNFVEGKKTYNVVAYLDFYPNDRKETIYRKETVSVDGLSIGQLNHSEIYRLVEDKLTAEPEAVGETPTEEAPTEEAPAEAVTEETE